MSNETSRSKIMLINMGGRGNIGDRAMALNDVRLIRERAPEAEILVGPHTLDFMVEEFSLKRYPYLSHCVGRWGGVESKIPKFLKLGGILRAIFYTLDVMLVFLLVVMKRYLRVHYQWSFMEAVLARHISETDVIFFCGGGYINDVGKLDSRTNLIMALLGIIAKKPVIMSGQGFGPFETVFSRFLLKCVIPKVDLITFRDVSGSVDLLKSLNIDIKDGRAVGDDAMSLPSKEVHSTEEKDWQGKRLGINFRISPFTPNLDQKVEEFTNFLRAVDKQYEWEINFFIFETWRPWEEGIIDKIIEESGIQNYVIHKTEDPREALYLTGKCDIALGISYHFIVFALKYGLPTIALYTGEYYRAKMEGLLDWYGKKDWAISVDNFSADSLSRLCGELVEAKDSYEESLQSKTKQMSDDCMVTIERAVSYL